MTIKGSMSTWDLLKKVADPQELKELKAIEDRHKKKISLGQGGVIFLN